MRFGTLCFVCGAVLCAETVSEPPTVGFVSAGTELRKIVGVAGSARQVVSEIVSQGAVVHPSRGVILGSDGERVVLSERGDAAAIWGTAVLRVIAGFGSEEPSTREIELPADVRAIAVSNGGERLAIASPAGVRIVGESERELPDIQSASALAFSGADLFVADAERALVWRIGESREVVATDVPDVTAIRAEGSKLVLARANGTILIRHGEGVEQVLDCRCKPTRLERLAAAGLWLLTHDATQPLWVLEMSDTEPRLWFVPASAVSEEPR
jgi:hypothetical protein